MRKVSFAVALLAVLMFAALPSHAATNTVTINGAAFGGVYTAPIVMAAGGDAIKLVNGDAIGAPHTLTLDSTAHLCKGSGTSTVACDTGVVNAGSNKTITFVANIAVGQYPWHCNVHVLGGQSTMHGLLIVQ